MRVSVWLLSVWLMVVCGVRWVRISVMTAYYNL